MTVWTTCWAPCSCCRGEISCSPAIFTASVNIVGAVFKFVFTLDALLEFILECSFACQRKWLINQSYGSCMVAVRRIDLGKTLPGVQSGEERRMWERRLTWCGFLCDITSFFPISREWERPKEKLSAEWTFCWYQKRIGQTGWRHRLYIKIGKASGCAKNLHCIAWPADRLSEF